MVNKKDELVEDYNTKLVLRDEGEGALLNLLEKAKSKGWQSVEITQGSTEAKRSLWFQGSMAGIEVRGYAPTLSDRSALERLKRDNRGSPLDGISMRADRALRDYDERVLPELKKDIQRLTKERETKGIRSTVLDIAYDLKPERSYSQTVSDDRYYYLTQKLSEATRTREHLHSLGAKVVRLRPSYQDGVSRYVPENYQGVKLDFAEAGVSRSELVRRRTV